MTTEDIIYGLKDLIRDKESFIKDENDLEDIFVQDKQVLQEAIKLIEQKQCKKADEMFKEINMNKKVHANNEKEEIDLVGYDRNNKTDVANCSIVFLIKAKEVATTESMNMQQLQAIYQKCREKRWIK